MKLNYKNRKSDGPKLGQIVAKDLRKQTKQCFAKSIPRPEISPLVLELPGKKLTDEGCLSMIEGLAETLEARNGVSPNRLEELHLSGNDLTTSSLRALAKIIKLAQLEIVDLDLSNNNITVKNDQEACDFTFFLESLRHCRVLRRLDLSHNNLSGPRAFECLTRVYVKQPVVEPLELEEWMGSDTSEEDKAADGDSTATLTERTRKLSLCAEHMSKGTYLKRREGLRAVPYIILNDCSMTDSGALFLSYALEKHYFPPQLMCPLKAGPQANQLDEYHLRTGCWGVVYLPNNALTDNGLKLLDKAEDARREFTGIEEEMGYLPSNGSQESFVMVSDQQVDEDERSTLSSRDTLRRMSNALDILRRRSTHDHRKHSVGLDIENYRKKIQRSTLEQCGYDSVDLWRCALKMLAIARVLFNRVRDENSPLPVVDRMPIMQMMDTHLNASSAAASSEADLPHPSATDSFATAELNSNHATYQVAQCKAAKFIHQNTTVPTILEENDDFERDPDLVGELPEDLWQGITLQAAGGKDIVSEQQQRAIIYYARDKASEELEKGDLGKPEAAQLWWILQRIGCLAYEMRT
ncbi:hypothetical protein IWX90DRAFT_476363 [Phyllosticta citrichinensis]|uniref:Leucine rich repeat protein n=1 Tax=Phyllosticta citrichinensis TaxID=1130410 RepID=A0ABR1XZP9_9PEZI